MLTGIRIGFHHPEATVFQDFHAFYGKVAVGAIAEAHFTLTAAGNNDTGGLLPVMLRQYDGHAGIASDAEVVALVGEDPDGDPADFLHGSGNFLNSVDLPDLLLNLGKGILLACGHTNGYTGHKMILLKLFDTRTGDTVALQSCLRTILQK